MNLLFIHRCWQCGDRIPYNAEGCPKHPGAEIDTEEVATHPLSPERLNEMLTLGMRGAPTVLAWEPDPATLGGWVAEYRLDASELDVRLFLNVHFPVQCTTEGGKIWVAPRES